MNEGSARHPAQRPTSNCLICQCLIEPGEDVFRCTSCRTVYHADCWKANRGCGVYGCPQVRQTEPRESIEVPVSYWGQEHKSCPACGAEILAAAVRCRDCGAAFQSAQPEDPSEFRSLRELEKQIPRVRKGVIVLFLCSAVSFLAPLTAVFGSVWYRKHRTTIKALPAFYSGVAKLALCIAIGQTTLIVVMVLLFSAFRAG